MSRLLLLNKPFEVLSQFTDRDRPDAPRDTLADYLSAPGYRPAGRLDYDSEGLLILTNDGALQDQIANPKHKWWKSYWVQVEGTACAEMCKNLELGVQLKDGMTLPARCKLLEIPTIWERNPPIRFRANVPDSWIELSIQEGRNRQVRRMTAAVGFPTLRLIRRSIGPYSLEGLAPGEYRYIEDDGIGFDNVEDQQARQPRAAHGRTSKKGRPPQKNDRATHAPKRGRQNVLKNNHLEKKR